MDLQGHERCNQHVCIVAAAVAEVKRMLLVAGPVAGPFHA